MKYILIILCLISTAYGQGDVTHRNVKITGTLQFDNTQKIEKVAINFGDTLSIYDNTIVTVKAIAAFVNLRFAQLYNYVNEVDEVPTDGTIETVAGITRVAPGIRKENFRRITTSNFTVAVDDVNIMYDFSGGGGTVTLPSLSADTDKNTYIIKNPTAGSLTYNNAVYTDNATSTTTLAAGKWVKLCVDNTAGKIWVCAGGTL